MSDTRFKVWLSKAGKKRTRQIPDLKSLPPTTETFTEHSKRAHLQTAIWYSSSQKNPPDLQPTDFGWMKVAVSRSLAPLTIHKNTPSVPPEPLENIQCGCKTDHPCVFASFHVRYFVAAMKLELAKTVFHKLSSIYFKTL